MYPNTEARCMACEIHDGPEEPCIPKERMDNLIATTGHPCPYRPPVSTDDGDLIRLVNIGNYTELGHLFQTHFTAAFGSRPPRRVRQCARMITAALLDSEVTAILKKQRDDAKREASDGRR